MRQAERGDSLEKFCGWVRANSIGKMRWGTLTPAATKLKAFLAAALLAHVHALSLLPSPLPPPLLTSLPPTYTLAAGGATHLPGDSSASAARDPRAWASETKESAEQAAFYLRVLLDVIKVTHDVEDEAVPLEFVCPLSTLVMQVGGVGGGDTGGRRGGRAGNGVGVLGSVDGVAKRSGEQVRSTCMRGRECVCVCVCACGSHGMLPCARACRPH